MGRATLEVADIFREFGPAWRQAQPSHLSLAQLKVISAIEQCRSAALGGHVLRCEGRGTDQIAYNSCRNRHCPKCQSGAAKRELDARQADLLPVEHYHVVFTLPAPIADIAYQNKAVVYGLLFDVAAETLLRIAADPKHVGASIGATLVLHTWGSAITHYPHVHGIVPGGVLAPDGKCWIACRPGFFLPVRVLSRLFRRRVLEELLPVHQAGKLQFFGEHTALADARPFEAWLAPLRKVEWVVYAKRLLARAARSGFGADVRRMLLDAAHVPIKHPTKMRMPKASKKGQFVITLATANGDPTVYPNASDGVDAPRPTERSDLERTQFRVSPTYRRRTFLSLNARCRK